MAPAPTRCSAPTPRPKSGDARSGSTTSAWRWAGPAGSCWERCWRRGFGWRGAFWVAGAPSMLLALAAAFVAAPARLARPKALPAPGLPACRPTYLIALAGRHPRHLRRQRPHLLDPPAHHRGAPLHRRRGQHLHAVRRPRLRRGGRDRRRLPGRRVQQARARAATPRAIGLSMLLAVPVGVAALLVTAHPPS